MQMARKRYRVVDGKSSRVSIDQKVRQKIEDVIVNDQSCHRDETSCDRHQHVFAHLHISPIILQRTAGSQSRIDHRLTGQRTRTMFPKLPPIISGSLPGPPQPNAPSLGHVFLRSPPISTFSHPSPKLISTSEPALEIREVAYSVFYPCDDQRKKGWVGWVPEPTKGVAQGYEKFVGRSGLSWMCKSTSSAD